MTAYRLPRLKMPGVRVASSFAAISDHPVRPAHGRSGSRELASRLLVRLWCHGAGVHARGPTCLRDSILERGSRVAPVRGAKRPEPLDKLAQLGVVTGVPFCNRFRFGRLPLKLGVVL